MNQYRYRSFFGTILLTTIMVFIFSHFVVASDITNRLPPLKTYPLPSFLASLNVDDKGDYFEEIEPHLVGYLIWTQFPVKVYLDSPKKDLPESSYQRYLQWRQAAQSAIASWQPYIPLEIVPKEDEADILIYRRLPPLRGRVNPETGLFDLPRITAATTRIQFYLSDSQPRTLHHKMIIEVSPNQSYDYFVSNIIHELGHAIGIWGHSLSTEDVMYYSLNRDIPSISSRDLNTLIKIYQQSTRLNGQIP